MKKSLNYLKDYNAEFPAYKTSGLNNLSQQIHNNVQIMLRIDLYPIVWIWIADAINIGMYQSQIAIDS